MIFILNSTRLISRRGRWPSELEQPILGDRRPTYGQQKLSVSARQPWISRFCFAFVYWQQRQVAGEFHWIFSQPYLLAGMHSLDCSLLFRKSWKLVRDSLPISVRIAWSFLLLTWLRLPGISWWLWPVATASPVLIRARSRDQSYLEAMTALEDALERIRSSLSSSGLHLTICCESLIIQSRQHADDCSSGRSRIYVWKWGWGTWIRYFSHQETRCW